jgi:conjugal transfer pilus assembly protein TraV
LGIGDDEFACPGLPAGVQCLSARQVYQATEQADTVTAPPDGTVAPPVVPVLPEGWQSRNRAPPAGTPPAPPAAPAATAPVVATVTPAPVPRLDGPLPIRTPAQVMRIWFGPWEDAAGNLHLTGFVYTEIEPRRWQVGVTAPVVAPVLQPLQVTRRETKSPTAGGSPPAGGFGKSLFPFP